MLSLLPAVLWFGIFYYVVSLVLVASHCGVGEYPEAEITMRVHV